MKKIHLIFIAFLILNFSFAQEKKGHEYCSHGKIKTSKLKIEKTNVGKNIDVKYHRLEFEIDPAKYYVKGINTIYFETKEELSSFTLDLFSSLTVGDVFYNNVKITTVHSENILTINLGVLLNANTLDSITIYYEGIPSGEGSTKGFNQIYHNGVPAIFTLSEPYGAREWWACKQDLDDKIDSVDIIVTTPSQYRAASNGVLISEEIIGENTAYHWKHRHSIAAYLVAIAVTNYVYYSEYAEITDGVSVEILNYLYPESLNTLKPEIAITADLLTFFSDLLIPYPFADEKYGHAEFGWGGGMEHQTMSFMGSWGFSIIAHELAHQWFGDYITCGSWGDIWLNEGFATYMEALAYEEFYGEESYQYDIALNYSNALLEPHGSVYVDDTTNIGRIFNAKLSYAKGGIVLHMLRKQFGDEIFFNSIKSYLNDIVVADKYARTADLKRHFEIFTKKNMDYFFDDWIYGKGYPNYYLTWSQNEANEMNFILNQTQTDLSVSFFEMKVPIKVFNNEKDTIVYLEHSSSGQGFKIPIEFRAVNVQIDPKKHILKGEASVSFAPLMDLSENILIAPNPLTDKCTVYLRNSFNFTKIEVYSTKGELIKQFKGGHFSSLLEFDLSFLPKGNYIIQFKTNNESIAKKIIKQ